jgi:hypothetical protein
MSLLSPIDKLSISSSGNRSIFQKRPSLKLPDQTPFMPSSPSSSPSPSPTFYKHIERKYNQSAPANTSNSALLSSTSSTSIGNISNPGLILASSSASTISSSQMFPNTTSTNTLAHSIAPFGSYSTPTTSQEQQQKTQRKTSDSLSSVNGALSSIGNAHDKLSLSSSADSSSSVPNSPPPNYDEVFDSSSATGTFNFVSSGTVAGNSNNSTHNNSTISSNSSVYPQSAGDKNCYDNKTYFQRLDSQSDETDRQTQNIEQTSKLQK